jgi:hypothetical protein
MPAIARILHFERKPPKPERPVCLSELRSDFRDRGLVLSVSIGLEIRAGDLVVHAPSSLAEAQAWLEADEGKMRDGRS